MQEFNEAINKFNKRKLSIGLASSIPLPVEIKPNLPLETVVLTALTMLLGSPGNEFEFYECDLNWWNEHLNKARN
jgi:hypothetical protein